MRLKKLQNQTGLEIILILVCLALCVVLHKVGYYRMVVLDLFYLPVLLAAFFLGRYHAGVVALLAVIGAAFVIWHDSDTLAAFNSPLAVGLALTTWAAAMGIVALFVGTVSDERNASIAELHDAYLGVVEVLSRHLNSADPRMGDRAAMVAEISQKVGYQLRLSGKEIDDIRVAALLHDIDNLEVTARVIRKAVGDVAHANRAKRLENTFNGHDLMQSLGNVLAGALPLLIKSGKSLESEAAQAGKTDPNNSGMGAEIIATVRSYVIMLSQKSDIENPRDALDALIDDAGTRHHPAVLHALSQVVLRSGEAARERFTMSE